MGNPFYRGIYAYDATNKPVAPATSSAFYRGIYTFNDAAVTVQSSPSAKKGENEND